MTVTLAATDGAGSGVQASYCSIDGGPTQAGTSVAKTAPTISGTADRAPKGNCWYNLVALAMRLLCPGPVS